MTPFNLALVAIILFLSPLAQAKAASFDCAKAHTPHEKHICNTPALNLADTRLGEAYHDAAQSFPLKGFVLATQRAFVSDYSHCDERSGQQCIDMVNKRIEELLSLKNSIVYTDQNPSEQYNPENGVFWISSTNRIAVLRYFGGWMPDAHTPKPFPNGFICNDEITLRQTAAGYAPSENDSDVKISNKGISAQISCSARNGLYGEYRRVR